ncbi:hypothetical protein BIV18_04985 [Peptoniphilus porci]|uniref:Uncharacterized protein n=1 Tax=Peptoniphilus porci TaxID=2652280 RepID=A0A1U7LZS3_9FIRM|nr:hypothetical protein BIV18_04985 [Peptoniphilus porci]
MFKNYHSINSASSTRGYGNVRSNSPYIDYKKGDVFEFRSFHNCWNSAGVKVFNDSLYISRNL